MTFIVGIAGGSASGKSAVADGIAAGLGDVSVLRVAHDRYYLPVPEGVDPAEHNYDEPMALGTSALAEHLDGLRAGRTVELPRYDFTRHQRATGVDAVMPADVILVEGLFVLTAPELQHLLDLRLYLDVPDDVRLARRVMRDVAERGRDTVGVVQQYLDTVRPMHEVHVAPARRVADWVLDGTAPLVDVVQRAVQVIQQGLAAS